MYGRLLTDPGKWQHYEGNVPWLVVAFLLDPLWPGCKIFCYESHIGYNIEYSVVPGSYIHVYIPTVKFNRAFVH